MQNAQPAVRVVVYGIWVGWFARPGCSCCLLVLSCAGLSSRPNKHTSTYGTVLGGFLERLTLGPDRSQLHGTGMLDMQIQYMSVLVITVYTVLSCTAHGSARPGSANPGLKCTVATSRLGLRRRSRPAVLSSLVYSNTVRITWHVCCAVLHCTSQSLTHSINTTILNQWRR